MRLSMVVELLLILLLIAFAAYGRVIERDEKAEERAIKDVNGSKQSNIGISTLSLKQATDNVNRYCTCNENICNCCRDFHIPLVQLQGPGCASLQYLQGDNLAVQLSFGDNILTSTIVNGKNPRPVCVPLPGGFTKFCGRIYSIKRDAKNHFKACLGLELQSATELEASLRVSCFRFGPDGLKLRPAEPLPVVEAEVSQEEDDDFFGLDDDDEDDDDAEDDAPLNNSVPTTSTEEDEEEDDDEDVLGFGALLDIITGEDETTTKKPKVTTPAPLLQFTIPILNRPTPPLVDSNVGDNVSTNDSEQGNEDSEESLNASEEGSAEASEEFAVLDESLAANETEAVVTEVSNKIASHVKPDKTPTKKFTASDANRKKPSVTSSSVNAIENETNKKKKHAKKPVKGEEDDDDDILEDSLDDDDDDDDEDEEILSEDDEKDNEEEEDEDENIDESEHENHEDEDEKAEVEDLDDDDEEEDAMISALVYDEKENGKKKGKVKKHQLSEAYDDDSDYGLGLTGLLARSRHSRNSE
ncbi:mitotic apparatus protein p62-like [Frieseomelitta varia]|uniref:mitotic apparatus protein p62-like n=1 Tax=Frieseomelitta varia TaxID=561572 RepID=UPI001CB6AC18|nr:mitotic apparatus protein p62-like [Frieseomelitta varia]